MEIISIAHHSIKIYTPDLLKVLKMGLSIDQAVEVQIHNQDEIEVWINQNKDPEYDLHSFFLYEDSSVTYLRNWSVKRPYGFSKNTQSEKITAEAVSTMIIKAISEKINLPECEVADQRLSMKGLNNSPEEPVLIFRVQEKKATPRKIDL
ncbi:MAG: hypothetical protein RL641_47 [Candidatus Parcubacteria bacterium]|jgi:hypothetical protein